MLTIHRTTFTEEMANLREVKEMIWHHVFNHFFFDNQILVIDSFPILVYQFVRTNRCQFLRYMAACGRDEVARKTFFGVCAHLKIC